MMKDLLTTLYRIENGSAKKYIKEGFEQELPDGEQPLPDDQELPPEDSDMEEVPAIDVDPNDVKDLTDKLVSGEMSYEEFKDALMQLESGEEPETDSEEGGIEPEMDSDDPYNQEYQGEGKCTDCKPITENCIKECGNDMSIGMPPVSKQDDQVSMTINMSGSGSGGIKDILNILRNIEDGGSTGSPDAGREIDKMIIASDDMGEDYANSPDEQYSMLKDIIKSGNDLHRSKDSYSDAPYRGDNPMALKAKMESLYNFVKSRKK